MTSPSEALKAAIEQFCAPDEDSKREGYTKIFERVHDFVNRLLIIKTGLTPSEREDVAAEVLGRLWANRDRPTFKGLTKWWNYVAQTTNWAFLDYIRTKGQAKEGNEDAIIGTLPDESEDLDGYFELLEDRRELYRLADEVFLGLPPELSDRERERRLFAAKMILVDKVPWQVACSILNAGTTEEDPVTRGTLDEWLSNRFAIRHLAYSELYWNNEKLCGHVLKGPNAPEWTEEQVLAVEMHLKYGAGELQIANAMEGRIKKSELSALLVRCRRRFPFIDIVKRLKRDLMRMPSAKEEIRAPGLWQRLVVQYHAKEELTAPQILDRIEPPSTAAGYPINKGMLNVDISSKRLQKKMADHQARRNERAVSSSGR